MNSTDEADGASPRGLPEAGRTVASTWRSLRVRFRRFTRRPRVRRLTPLAAAVAVLWLVEAVARQSPVAPLLWTVLSPVPVLLNLGLLAMIGAFFAALTGTVRRGAVAALVPVTVMAAIHGGKMLVLGDAFYPWDLELARETVDIFGGGYFPFGPVAVATFLVMLVVVRVPLALLPGGPIRWPTRCVLAVVMLAGLIGFTHYRAWPLRHVVRAVVTNYNWDQRQNYRVNGLLLAFTINMQSHAFLAPADYGPNRMAAVVEDVAAPRPATRPANDRPANLIVLLSESFWDPTDMPAVQFHRDPLRRLRAIRGAHTAFEAISPVHGGATCNAEFELLTGLPVALLPAGAIPYQRFITQPIPALPAILRDNGYTTVAIHPFHRWYWNRNNVYELIGFDRFIALEDCDDWTIAAKYVSDHSLVDKIIETASEQTGPYFIFALSMQNHGPYEHRNYDKADVDVLVTSQTLPRKHLRTIENMSRGLMLSDAALGRLVDYFAGQDEPTVIVFLGDHLPLLGKDFDLYRRSGLVREAGPLSPAERKRLHTVPGVIWSNDGRDPGDLGTLSMMYLMPTILDRLGLADEVPFTQWHAALHHRLPVWNTYLFQPGPHAQVHPGLPSNDPFVDHGRLILYDLLEGRQYCLKALFATPPTEGS